MFKSSRICLISVLASAVFLGLFGFTRNASALPGDWDGASLFGASNGLINPALLVGFNPQPEPPAATSLSSIVNGAAQFVVSGVSNPVGAPPQLFQFVFGVGGNAPIASVLYPPDPVNDFRIGFSFAGASGATSFTAVVDVVSSSGGGIAPGTAKMFNPQPEPPALGFGGFESFGLQFAMTSLSDVTLTVRLLDAAGNQLDLSALPIDAPATLALLGIALAGLGAVARRRRVA